MLLKEDALTMTNEEIYLAFPRHVAKVAALKAIQKSVHELSKLMGEQMARDFLYGATLKFAASDAGKRGQFTPHPATWFNQGRYLDDPKEWEGRQNGAHHSKNKYEIFAEGNS